MMNFIYNRENVKSFPLKLKEWNFYQFIFDHYSLQITLGHVSYMTSASATLINLLTHERYEIGCMKPLWSPTLDLNPEWPSNLVFENETIRIEFDTNETKRTLKVNGTNNKYEHVEIDVDIENDLNNEKMVIATPFKKKTQFACIF